MFSAGCFYSAVAIAPTKWGGAGEGRATRTGGRAQAWATQRPVAKSRCSRPSAVFCTFPESSNTPPLRGGVPAEPVEVGCPPTPAPSPRGAKLSVGLDFHVLPGEVVGARCKELASCRRSGHLLLEEGVAACPRRLGPALARVLGAGARGRGTAQGPSAVVSSWPPPGRPHLGAAPRQAWSPGRHAVAAQALRELHS